MADLKKARENPQEQFWDQLDDLIAGMLGMSGSGQHMQPMSHQVDRDGKRLIFYTDSAANFFEGSAPGQTAHFTIISKDQDYHACMSGPLTQSKDPELIDKYWSPVIAAWFDSQNDPTLSLLILDLKDAAIWASTDSSLKFGWEIAKANMTDSDPDVGVRTSLTF